jgi:branched-chain amino acid aminotransferase
VTLTDFAVVGGSRATAEVRSAVLADPGFGRSFTDHVASASWDGRRGWHDASIAPLAPLSLHPGTSVLHYGQAVIEGLKAYRHEDG